MDENTGGFLFFSRFYTAVNVVGDSGVDGGVDMQRDYLLCGEQERKEEKYRIKKQP